MTLSLRMALNNNNSTSVSGKRESRKGMGLGEGEGGFLPRSLSAPSPNRKGLGECLESFFWLCFYKQLFSFYFKYVKLFYY